MIEKAGKTVRQFFVKQVKRIKFFNVFKLRCVERCLISVPIEGLRFQEGIIIRMCLVFIYIFMYTF